ncbi:hypothetical protein [Sphingomonas hylomeconis]|uniref:Uncharacterized protein n=1 Tax=Sphingomonas hylomeconis TaxID=1395958 RepID=A0ABV7SQJ4_9SPHN|nr:hypothetical protein [Sphingomonas hylomeconis]
MTALRILDQITNRMNLFVVPDREDRGGSDRQQYDHQQDMAASDHWPVPMPVLRPTPVLDNFDSAFIHIAASRRPARERNRFGSIPRISKASRDFHLSVIRTAAPASYRQAAVTVKGARDE